MPVEIEKIEGEEHGLAGIALAPAGAECLWQGAEIGTAIFIENDGFAIKDHRAAEICGLPPDPSG